MSLKRRVEALEAQDLARGATWFDLATWEAEHAAGVPLVEQERRRLAEYPNEAEEIRATFARIRARLRAVEAMGDPESGRGD